VRPPYPRPFKYVRASTVEEALQYVEEGYRPLAGGQSLSTLLKLGLAHYEGLVDIFELDELRYIKSQNGMLKIGALVVHNDVALNRLVVSHSPALAKAAWHIADLQVRNRGTIGGSIAHADPSANYLPILMALGAEVSILTKSGSRSIPISQFIRGPYATAAEGGIVTEVSVPKWDRQGFALIKRGTYPSLVVAVAARLKDGVVAQSRLAVGGLYTRPVVIEGVLDGLSIDEVDLRAEEVGKRVEVPEGEPYSDVHMAYEKKREALPRVISKAVRDLVENAWKLPTRDEITHWRGRGGNGVAVNGVEFEVAAEPRRLLVDFLRELGFKEVKRGCDEGRCGACTILMDGRAVKACTIFAPQAAGHEIKTIRALSGHPVQKAFLEEYAMQCGYCTHGFMMATINYLDIDPTASDDTLKLSIKNVCRCTGYVNIIKAIKRAAIYTRKNSL